MKAEYINPFLEATNSVIPAICNVQPTLGNLHLKDNSLSYSTDRVGILIGMTGEMRGQIIFAFPSEVAKRVISSMMGGVAVNAFDELAISAIGELGNMIVGNATTLLSQQGIKIDITPPSVFLTDNITINNKGTTLSIPILLQEIGEMELDIAVQDLQ